MNRIFRGFDLLLIGVMMGFLACEGPVDRAASAAACLQTLETHLSAISQKNIDSLTSTLSPEGELYLILPQTPPTFTVEEFIRLHEAWFQETGWTYDWQILHTEIGLELALAVVEVMYREADRNGKPYFNKMIVSYGLKQLAGKWYVFQDHACSLEKSES